MSDPIEARVATSWPKKIAFYNGMEPDFGSSIVKGAGEVAGDPPKLIVRHKISERPNFPPGWIFE